MTQKADVCIIGGGLIGTSIAYYLSKTNKKIVLLERRSIGSGTASSTFGLLCIQLFKYFGVVDSYLKICEASLRMYMEIEKELKADVQYRKTGGMVVIKDEEDLRSKSELVNILQSKGVDIEILDRKETLALAPALMGDDILGSSFSPIEAEIHPHFMADAFARRARENGVEIVCDAPVTAISMAGDRVRAVQTPKGEFQAEFYVNASGKWGAEVARLAGIEFKMNQQRGQVLLTEPMRPFLDIAVQHIPLPEIDEQGRHIVQSKEIRQMVHGNLLIGGTREDDRPELVNTYEGVTGVARRAIELVPAVREARIIRAFSGVRNIPEDGLPIMGFVDEVPGWVNAVMHVGVTLAPITGKLTAELIQDGKTSLDISDFALSRFRKPNGHQVA